MARPPTPPGAESSTEYSINDSVWVYRAGKWREGTVTGKDGSSDERYVVQIGTNAPATYGLNDIRKR